MLISRHPVYTDELLIELGWLTVAYGRLEELMVQIISAFENPQDSKATFDRVFRLGLQDKIKRLRGVFTRRCTESGINQQAEMDRALGQLEIVAEERNIVVHGLVYEEAEQLLFRRRGEVRLVSVDQVRSVNRGLLFTQIELLKPVHAVWNATLGNFDQKPVAKGE